jgi:hypothetical protein
MLKRTGRACGFVVLTALASLPVAESHSQVPQPNGGLPGPGRTSEGFIALPENANPHPDANRALEDSMRVRDNTKRFEQLNVLRHKEMASDTEKLVALANQVKTEMDTASHDSLSMESVRQVEQIEKLAHTVRDKMRASVSE